MVDGKIEALDSPTNLKQQFNAKNMDEVFEHFDPKINVAFEDDEGKITREELGFKNVGDFSINGLIAQSPFLADLKTKNEQYQKMIELSQREATRFD